MKHTVRLICLLLAAMFAFSGCNTEVDPPVSDDSTDVPVSDTDSGSDTTEAPDTSKTPVQDFDPSADTRYGTAVNVDCDAIWYMYAANGEKLDDVEQMCIDWFDSRYKDAGVSDVMYNVDQNAPSTTRESYMDFYTEAKANGTKLDDVTARHGELLYRVYTEHNVDPYTIWFELCRENNINPWLSFRMNDIHAPTLGYACTDFYYEAKEKGWLIGPNNARGSWCGDCMDYSVPEVREYFLSYIDEMMGRYDAYGVELDFLRSLYCFKTYSTDNCKYMDTFMKDLNEIVTRYEKEYGHEIKIIVRIAREIEANRYYGFDVVNWAKNDWIDIAAPSSFGPTDSDVPVAAWKEALREYGVEVYVAYESITIDNKHPQSETTLAAFSSMYLQQGADKIYLYNMFNSPKGYYGLCSSLQSALKYAKREYVVTSQTEVPKAPGVTAFAPLPINVLEGKETKPIVIRHGYMATKWDTYICVGLGNKDVAGAEECNLTAMYNGVECEFKGKVFRSHAGNDTYDSVVYFQIPKDAWINSTCGEITFTADDYVKISYLELMNGHPTVG